MGSILVAFAGKALFSALAHRDRVGRTAAGLTCARDVKLRNRARGVTVHVMHVAWLIVPLAALLDGGTSAPGNRPACVNVTFFARFQGVGYGHWVTVQNNCAMPMSCTVNTNVNPIPTTVQIPAGESTMVNTFFTSPASGFVPTVHCARERG